MRAAVASFRDAASLPVERQDWVTLGSVFEPLLPARFPPGQLVKLTPIRESSDHCRVLEAADIGHFHVRTRPQWASYADIAASFGSSRGPSHLSRIPESLVAAPVKLLLADQSSDLKCALSAERLYPKRAWIGSLLPGWDLEMAFASTGILNSAAGLVLYRALAKRGGISGREISKKVLEQFPLPLPSRNPDAFRRVALLAYRIQLLHEAPTAEPDLDSLITNHCLRLLSEVVDLYGWSEGESRELLREAQGLGRRDLPGDQGELFFQLRSPFLAVPAMSSLETDRYEELKQRARSGSLSDREVGELEAIRARIEWLQRLGSPVPRFLAAPEWMGAADERQALKAAGGNSRHRRLTGHVLGSSLG